MRQNPTADWITLAHDGYWLWAESLMVMGMRTTDILTGRSSARENALMVSEKVKAASDVGLMLAGGGTASGAIKHYRRKVTANRKRLSAKKR